MSEDRPSDYSNHSDDTIDGAQIPKAPGLAKPGSEHRGFTVQTGGRNAIAGTAERIGKAAGSAQRQMRRGLELVRTTAPGGRSASYGYATGGAGHGNALEKEPDEVASGMTRRVEDEVAEARHEAAHRVGQYGELAAERLLLLGEQLRDAVSHSRLAARRLVTDYPVQTITAAVAGFCVVFGVTLGLRSSRRR